MSTEKKNISGRLPKKSTHRSVSYDRNLFFFISPTFSLTYRFRNFSKLISIPGLFIAASLIFPFMGCGYVVHSGPEPGILLTQHHLLDILGVLLLTCLAIVCFYLIRKMKQSEKRFRRLFKKAPLPMAHISLDGKILDVNDGLVEMLGFTSKELSSLEDAWKLHLPDPNSRDLLTSQWRKDLDQALSGHFHMEPLECPLATKKGEMLTAILTTRLLGDSIVVSFFDITKRKKAERAIDFERRQLLSIFNSLNVIIYVSDPHTHEIIFANQYLMNLIGKNPTGGLCYQELQGLDQPCDFCTNPIILKNGDKSYSWQFHNPITNTDVDIVDRIIRWPDGRKLRLEVATDITEKKQAIAALQKKDVQIQAITENMPGVIFQGHYINRDDFTVNYASQGLHEIFGIDPNMDEFFKHFLSHVHEEDRKNFLISISKSIESAVPWIFEGRFVKSNETRWFHGRATATRIDDKVVFDGILLDVTSRKEAEEERNQLQEQLLQSQKLEAVGILAGGIAHDFNNMLGAIMGYAELTINEMVPGDKLRENMIRILDASRRSTDLTRQLLAFARKQTIEPVVLNLNEAVEGILKMIRRLIGENIELIWQPSSTPCLIRIDPAQLDQILVNLCVNARDAIDRIGRITIETDIVSSNEIYLKLPDDMEQENHVFLAVSDNGCGMNKDVRDRIFEPFFTTKEMGEGTGMGLATVHGIVKQNNGMISVFSEPGHGTTFKIHFPRPPLEATEKITEDVLTIPQSKGEIILLIEDDPTLLEMSLMMLEKIGYTVHTAATPTEAISITQKTNDEIHLILTDVIMPEMNGKDLAEQLKKIQPQVKCLFMSGYTAEIISHKSVLKEGINFIKKPFTLKEIAVKIRRVLD